MSGLISAISAKLVQQLALDLLSLDSILGLVCCWFMGLLFLVVWLGVFLDENTSKTHKLKWHLSSMKKNWV